MNTDTRIVAESTKGSPAIFYFSFFGWNANGEIEKPSHTSGRTDYTIVSDEWSISALEDVNGEPYQVIRFRSGECFLNFDGSELPIIHPATESYEMIYIRPCGFARNGREFN